MQLSLSGSCHKLNLLKVTQWENQVCPIYNCGQWPHRCQTVTYRLVTCLFGKVDGLDFFFTTVQKSHSIHFSMPLEIQAMQILSGSEITLWLFTAKCLFCLSPAFTKEEMEINGKKTGQALNEFITWNDWLYISTSRCWWKTLIDPFKWLLKSLI